MESQSISCHLLASELLISGSLEDQHIRLREFFMVEQKLNMIIMGEDMPVVDMRKPGLLVENW
jgi:hypothetical protein